MNEEKILIIANSIVGEFPGLTGGEVRFIEIAKTWAKKGYEINLLSCFNGYKLYLKYGFKGKFHNSSNSSSDSRGEAVLRLFKSFCLPKSLNKLVPEIVYSSSEQIYDVIPGLILKLKNHKPTKMAVVVHWLPPIKWWERKQSNFFNSLFFVISERIGLYLACIFADKIFAVSNSTTNQISNDFIAKFFRKKVETVECGVDVDLAEKLAKTVKKKKVDAIFLKRIQAVKGIFDIIEIWEKVVKQIPKAQLNIVGSGIDEFEAKERVKEKKIENNIHFLGSIFDKKMKFLSIAQSKLFLLPSYEENWAIVIGEAMAAKVPVVCYSLKELVDVWGDNIVGIKTGDTEQFAIKVLELLDNPKKRSLTNQKAGIFIKRFDWKRIAEKELSLIVGNESLINKT